MPVRYIQQITTPNNKPLCGQFKKPELSIHNSTPLNNSNKIRVANLYVKYHKNILAYIISLGIKQPAAEDLTQNVFLQICSNYVSGQKITNLQGYLFGVARYLVFEYCRKAEQFPIILFSEDIENIVINFPAGRTEAIGESNSLIKSIPLKTLNAIVTNLSHKYREAFELRYIQSLSLDTAAKRARCSKNTLCQRACRATKIIRAKLKLS